MIIYTKDDCAYCVKAKNALQSVKISYEEIPVTDFEKFKKEHDWKTFPLIYTKSGEKIGGYNELVKWILDNGLF